MKALVLGSILTAAALCPPARADINHDLHRAARDNAGQALLAARTMIHADLERSMEATMSGIRPGLPAQPVVSGSGPLARQARSAAQESTPVID